MTDRVDAIRILLTAFDDDVMLSPQDGIDLLAEIDRLNAEVYQQKINNNVLSDERNRLRRQVKAADKLLDETCKRLQSAFDRDDTIATFNMVCLVVENLTAYRKTQEL